jgi:hypothetical protein
MKQEYDIQKEFSRSWENRRMQEKIDKAQAIFDLFRLDVKKVTPFHWKISGFYEDKTYDFWPTTCKWRVISTGIKGEGIESLLNQMSFDV